MSLDTPELKSVWSVILSKLDKDSYVPSHISAARLAKVILNDEAEYRRLINGAKNLRDGQPSDFVWLSIAVAQELSDDPDNNRDEIYSLTDETLDRASTTDFNDLEQIINFIAGRYQGSRLGNVQYAEKAIKTVLDKVTDSKTKASFKKKAEKSLKNA